mmetsp:Transcript_16532/g.37024  ORF Transcript_16532/g.37024 Transcript_16532/m.37024 type:complete len:202 (-) Transcript_16532:546-1151(-)
MQELSPTQMVAVSRPPRRSRRGLGMQPRLQQHNDHAHVVTAPQPQAVVDKRLADGAKVPLPWRLRGRLTLVLLVCTRHRAVLGSSGRSAILQHIEHLVDDFLRAHDVPYAVAREYDELIRLMPLLGDDLGEGGHGLLLGPHALATLVDEIPERPRNGQIAIDPIELHLPVRFFYSLLLLRQIWLVVIRQGHCLAGTREYGP